MISSVREQSLSLDFIIVIDARSHDTYTSTYIFLSLLTRDDNTAGSLRWSQLETTLQYSRVGCQILYFTCDSLGICQYSLLNRAFVCYPALQGNKGLIINYLTWHTCNGSRKLCIARGRSLLTQIGLRITIHKACGVSTGCLVFQSLDRTMECSRCSCYISRTSYYRTIVEQRILIDRIVIIATACQEDTHDEGHNSV